MSSSLSGRTKSSHPVFLIKLEPTGFIKTIYKLDEKGGLISDRANPTGFETLPMPPRKRPPTAEPFPEAEKEKPTCMKLPKKMPIISSSPINSSSSAIPASATIVDHLLDKVKEQHFTSGELFPSDSFNLLFPKS
jgi:hypothetical protein